MENWLKTIDVSGSVLDVGGSQNEIKGRTKTWEAEEYKILDLKNPHQTKQKPDFEGDIQDIYAIEKSGGNQYYDIIFFIEVLEYIVDPLSTFININSLLKKGGILYLSTHALYGLHNPKGEDCLRYTKNAIIKLAKETGFEIEEMIPRELSPEGKNLYYRFCHTEGMRLDYQDEETYVEGYLCKMIKKHEN